MRKYASEVTQKEEGNEVHLAGWVHEIRDLGKLKFIILRDRTGLIQLTLKKGSSPEEVFAVANELIKETAIECKGIAKASKIAHLGREVFPTEMKIVGKVLKQVPFEVTGKVPAELDVRLDNRSIDLRRIETQAIFKIRAEVQKAFRETLNNEGFQEINPPCLVGSATEGGTDLFPVIYFEREAFLAQSPQLYKQLAVLGGIDKCFMITPVWRAEKHNTTQHLNEITQMDAEMGFSDEKYAVEVLEKVFIGMLSAVKSNCGEQLKTLNVELKVPEKVKSHTYTGLVELLNKEGIRMEWGEDFSKENEAKISEIIEKKDKSDAYFITEWPTQVRAFYSMPFENKKEICKAYDLMYRGLEISSGAQRIHDPEMLAKQIRSRGMNPENFESYIDAFRYGAIPHAGWSIGAERLVMKICNLKNIREAALFPRDRNRLTP